MRIELLLSGSYSGALIGSQKKGFEKMRRFRLDRRTFCRKQGVEIMARRGSEAYFLTSRRQNIESRWGFTGKVAFLGSPFSCFSLLFTCESRFFMRARFLQRPDPDQWRGVRGEA